MCIRDRRRATAPRAIRNPLKARQCCNPPQFTIRLNPQSAVRDMNDRFRRSNMELRGPRNGLEIGPRSSRG
eukprot:6808182-Alexandrium_andersonii.AAC.1